jgi:hypothetical protein
MKNGMRPRIDNLLQLRTTRTLGKGLSESLHYMLKENLPADR